MESRSLSPAHQGDYIREVLAGLQVRQFLTPEQKVPTLQPDDSLSVVLERLSNTPYLTLPVVDGAGALLGTVSLEQVHLASQSPNLAPLVLAADLMRTDVTPLRPDDRLDRALELFVESDLLALPVVEGVEVARVIGIVKRVDVSSTYLKYVQGDGSNMAGSGI